MSRWTFGEIIVERVLEFEGPLFPPSVLFPASTSEAIDSLCHWLEPDLLDPKSGQLVLAFNTYVIRTPRSTILVDTCGGNDKHRPQKPRYHMKKWLYLENLLSLGIKPEDVDYVLCTHLHVDHVGWNTKLSNGRWISTFPNAQYLFVRDEWEYWQHQYQTDEFTDDPYYEDSILPIIAAGQAVFIEKDYAFEKGIWLDPTPGHTPGHVCLHISSGGVEAVMSGDVMHHPLQCTEPLWNSCFCVNTEQAQRTRYAFLDRYANTATLIMPAHFPTPSVGRIVSSGPAWRFSFEGVR
ncbi:MAG: MBL fold metallo-hydrolase [Desulfobacterales bacterium]|nr:MAG: MBL fold metallo-hydrolase [Desulfobacterales bacterium]